MNTKSTAAIALLTIVTYGVINPGISQAFMDLINIDDAVSEYLDPQGNIITIETGRFGEITNYTDGSGSVIISRTTSGLPERTTHPNGAITSRTFDSKGNKLSETNQTLGGTTSFAYGALFNQIEGAIDAFQNQYTFSYDENGNSTESSSPSGLTTTSTFQGQGLLTSYVNADGNSTIVTYDTNQNLSKITSGTGDVSREIQFTYTNEGFLDTTIDALGNIIDRDYDVMGRAVSKELAEGHIILFGYDSSGNLTSITPPGRAAYTYIYNSSGLLSAQLYPEVDGDNSQQISYDYDSNRRLTKETTVGGVEINYQYDSVGRMTSLSQPDGIYSYSYDEISENLTSITSPYGVTQELSYLNELLRGVTWSGEISGSVTYEFDLKARLSKLVVDGTEFATEYNTDDSAIVVGDFALSYDSDSGRLLSTNLDNIDETYEYNEFGELIKQIVFFESSEILNVQYFRDKVARIIQKIETIEGVTKTYDYEYDALGRLVSSSEDLVLTASYNYDNNSNIVSNNAVFDTHDKLLSDNNASYQNSPQGERIRVTTEGQITTYEYNAQSHLTRVNLPSGDEIDYLLDGQNRRVVKRVNGAFSESWIYSNATSPVASVNDTGEVIQHYIYVGDATTASYLIDDNIKYRMISDQVGSIRLVINSETGEIKQRIDYDPWGKITSDTNPGFQPLAYAGGLYDQDSQLTHFGLREYDANTSRWTARDPIGFLGGQSNLFEYVFSNPIGLNDVNGLDGNDPTIVSTTFNTVYGTQTPAGTSELAGATEALIAIQTSKITGAAFSRDLFVVANTLGVDTPAANMAFNLLESLKNSTTKNANSAELLRWLESGKNRENWQMVVRKARKLPKPKQPYCTEEEKKRKEEVWDDTGAPSIFDGWYR